MRVSPISFKNVSSSQRKSADRAYWHLLKPSASKEELQRLENKKNIRALIMGLFMVGAAVTIAIFKYQKKGATLAGREIVNLADNTMGLNKIKKYEGNIQEIKEKIIYPYKAVIMGDKEPLHCNMQKTGLILGGKNKEEVQEVLEATAEHARALGINVVTCPFEKFKVDIANRLSRSSNKEEEARKILGQRVRNWLFKELERGEARFNKSVPSGKYDYTFINLGSIDTLVSKDYLGDNLRALQGLMKKANNQDTKGVCWLSSAGKSQTFDFFADHSSILVTKLIE